MATVWTATEDVPEPCVLLHGRALDLFRASCLTAQPLRFVVVDWTRIDSSKSFPIERAVFRFDLLEVID